MKRHPTTFDLLLWCCGGLILLFVVAPLAGMALQCTWPALWETAQDTLVQRSIVLTLLASFLGTAVFSLLAVPFAWLLARNEFRGKRLLLGLVDLPVVIPHSTAGIA
ncbi:MAG: hypothetical protein ACD_62C00666G0001, partial [uncultured bacterium]